MTATATDQVRGASVAMLYRHIARAYYRDAELAFAAGWEAVGVVLSLTGRRLERAAKAEMKNPEPA